MSYTLKQLPNEPIVIAKFSEPFDVLQDTNGVAAALTDILNNTSGSVYYIADMEAVQIAFSDMVVGLAEAFSNKNSPYVNPRLSTYTVANDKLIEMATKAAANQDQYGNANVTLYASIDDALAVIRGKIK